MKRNIIAAITVWIVFLISQTSAYAATFVYIPMDNRPVCLDDALQAMQSAGINVLVPPEELLAGRDRSADPEQLWDWLESSVKNADAVVLSADSLLYGGLVSSRIHHLPQTVLEKRLLNFRQLRERNPSLPIYVFSTIMRTPRFTAGGMDAAYFEDFGEQLFRYSALQDKKEVEQLTKEEQQELAGAFAAVPESVMLDWLSRRQINYNINAQLLALTRERVFSYFVLGRDDHDRYSRTQLELRNLLKAEPTLAFSSIFSTFSGADQLGLILLTRAVNLYKSYRPFVAAIYAPGVGKATIPAYQGETVFTSVLNHVSAAGGYLIFSPQNADLVLAVNTAEDGITREAANPVNTSEKRSATDAFVTAIEKQLPAKPVAVADIAFANGSDNALLTEMMDRDVVTRLAAYSGWNTASNSIGFAIAQGMLTNSMSESDRLNLLKVRLLDDWAYQANVRQDIKHLIAAKGIDEVFLQSHQLAVEAETTAQLNRFATERFTGFSVPVFTARHPWQRMFEVQIVLSEK